MKFLEVHLFILVLNLQAWLWVETLFLVSLIYDECKSHLHFSYWCLMVCCLWIGLDVVIYFCDHNHIHVLEIIWKYLTIGKAAIFLMFLVLRCVAHGQVAALVCSPDKARRAVCCCLSQSMPVGQYLCMTV